VLNRYGIQTEFSGNICVNLNVVIQDKELLMKARREKKDKEIKEMANLMAYIENTNNTNMMMDPKMSTFYGAESFNQTSAIPGQNHYTKPNNNMYQ
jgi:hypothetical protein